MTAVLRIEMQIPMVNHVETYWSNGDITIEPYRIDSDSKQYIDLDPNRDVFDREAK